MAVFGAVIFSAVRVCQGCADSFPCPDGDEEREGYREDAYYDEDYGDDPPGGGACGSQQFEHRHYHSRNRRYLNLRGKP